MADRFAFLDPFYSDDEEPEPRRCVCGAALPDEPTTVSQFPEAQTLWVEDADGQPWPIDGHPAYRIEERVCGACGEAFVDAMEVMA